MYPMLAALSLVLAFGLLPLSLREGQITGMTMHLPDSTDFLAPLGPFNPASDQRDVIFLLAAVLLALSFTAYLLRCYLQEFRYAIRVRRLKRLACLKSPPPAADRQVVIEECRQRRDAAIAIEPVGCLPALDWRGLHALIPSHERLTLVWDTGLANHVAPPKLYLDKETITGSGEASIR